jgi:acyl-homoserine lactone acylase PvdQ
VETCAQQVDAALAAALDELSARFGNDPAAWKWGAAHAVHAEHRPFSNVALLSRLFQLEAPCPATPTPSTPCASGWATPRAAATAAPTARACARSTTWPIAAARA